MGVVLELLTGDAIPTLLPSLDDVTVGLNPGKKLLNDLLMPRIGCANQAVIADLPAIPEFAVLGTDPIAVGLGAEASSLGCALNLLAVLITPGDEQDLLTLEPLKPGLGITGQGCVRTPLVGIVVDVIEGGGEGVSRRDPTQPFPSRLRLRPWAERSSHPCRSTANPRRWWCGAVVLEVSLRRSKRRVRGRPPSC